MSDSFAKNLDLMKIQCDEQQNDNEFKINEYKQQFINDANGIFSKYLSQSSFIISIFRLRLRMKLKNNFPLINLI
jgi:hypothetical protein